MPVLIKTKNRSIDQEIDQEIDESLENNMPIAIIKNYPKEWDDENL